MDDPKLSKQAETLTQVLDGRYVDRKKLLRTLKDSFGENWSARLQLNSWILSIPSLLTEEQIELCFVD